MNSHLDLKCKILALFLMIALVVSQITPVFALNAETDPMIIVSDATGSPGGTASVTIDLKNNPGIVSMTLRMSYNDEILTLTEVKDAGVLGSTSHKPELVNPYTLVWVNDTATTNYTVNGTIVTLVFTVADTAEKGTVVPIEINYNYDNYDIYDKDANKINFGIDNGSVTVGEPGSNDISDFTTEVHDAASSTCNTAGHTEHTFGKWSITKESTATEKGWKEKVCKVCGYKIVEEISDVDTENDGDINKSSAHSVDNSNLLLWVVKLFVSGSCLIVLILFYKKRSKQKR